MPVVSSFIRSRLCLPAVAAVGRIISHAAQDRRKFHPQMSIYTGRRALWASLFTYYVHTAYLSSEFCLDQALIIRGKVL